MACNNFKAIPNEIAGGFQQYALAYDAMIFKISEKLSLEEASLAEPAASAFASVERANIYPGEALVVIGPGPIGLLTLQAAKMKFPSSIIVIGTRNERLVLAKEFGADYVINSNETDSFDEIVFHKKVAKMKALDLETIEYVFYNGHREIRRWQNKPRSKKALLQAGLCGGNR